MPPPKLSVGTIDMDLIMIHPHFRTEHWKNKQWISVSMQPFKTRPFHYDCIQFVKSFALFSVIGIIVHMLA